MAETTPQDAAPLSESEIVAARRAKLKRFRDELGFEPYGQRVDGLLPLADARALFSEEAHAAHEAAAKLAKDATPPTSPGPRTRRRGATARGPCEGRASRVSPQAHAARPVPEIRSRPPEENHRADVPPADVHHRLFGVNRLRGVSGRLWAVPEPERPPERPGPALARDATALAQSRALRASATPPRATPRSHGPKRNRLL